MKSIKLFSIFVLLSLILIPAVSSYGDCNETWNMTGNTSINYNWTITKVCPTDYGNETSIAIVIFLLFIVSGLFFIPFKVTFHKHEILNDVAKRCFWMLGLVLLALTTVLVTSFSATANFGVTDELFRILWIVEWGSYLFMLWIFLSFQFRIIKHWRTVYRKARMGETYDERE